jgi:GR25 family glycosyltransferase involved in LPS biosynthesis
MKYFVISLRRSPERLASFYAVNGHRDRIEHFEAVDGRMLERNALVEQGVIEDSLTGYTPGAWGCAMSHMKLWQRAVALDEPITVFEDDAILHPAFFETAARILPGSEWDYVQWAWNFNSYLTFMLPGNTSPCVAQFSEEQMRTELEAYRRTDPRPQLFRLLGALGTPAYSVTSAAAAKLLDWCFPLAPMQVYFWGLDRKLSNTGIDIVLNTFFQDGIGNPQVAFPPLVVTPNDKGASTVQRGDLEPLASAKAAASDA